MQAVEPVGPLLGVGDGPVRPRLDRGKLALELGDPRPQALDLGAPGVQFVGLLGAHRFSAIRGASRLKNQTPSTNTIDDDAERHQRSDPAADRLGGGRRARVDERLVHLHLNHPERVGYDDVLEQMLRRD